MSRGLISYRQLVGSLERLYGRDPFNQGRDPFNQNSNRSDREKRTTSKGGPVFRNFSGWTEPIH